jgi:hypothetical protein
MRAVRLETIAKRNRTVNGTLVTQKKQPHIGRGIWTAVIPWLVVLVFVALLILVGSIESAGMVQT